MVIRPIIPREHDAVGDLCVRAYGELASAGYAETLRDVATREASALVLVAVEDDREAILGTVTFVADGGPLHEIAAADEAEFRMLAVDPWAQGRGVGDQLVRACLARARARGRRQLVASSLPSMKAAHRVYERLGFTRAPERDWSPVEGVELVVFERYLTPTSGA
jgi:ribosomal protein S18 acetylase RimI-like enzyme